MLEYDYCFNDLNDHIIKTQPKGECKCGRFGELFEYEDNEYCSFCLIQLIEGRYDGEQNIQSDVSDSERS